MQWDLAWLNKATILLPILVASAVILQLGLFIRGGGGIFRGMSVSVAAGAYALFSLVVGALSVAMSVYLNERNFQWANEAVSFILFAAACFSVVVFAYYARQKAVSVWDRCVWVVKDEQNLINLEQQKQHRKLNRSA